MYHLQPLSSDRIVSRDRRFQRMAAVLAGLRILVGLTWLAAIAALRPSGFGVATRDGLWHALAAADRHALEPARTIAHAALPHPSIVGWSVLGLCGMAGILLLVGWHTTIGGAIGTLLAVVVAATLVGQPGESTWALAMLVALNATTLAAPTNLRVSLDAALGRA